MTKHILMLSSALLLAGCFGGASQYEKTAATSGWVTKSDTIARTAQADTLKNWWLGFEDDNLNALVAEALNGSPDRNIAMARITEARGLRRSTRSSLFPQIGASAQIGRADNGSFGGAGGGADDVYDAAFDASYEIDVFGHKTLPSANFEPVLMTPSNVIANRPDVNAAAAALSAQSNLSYAAMVDIFPSFTLSGLYGITRSTFVDRTNIWSLAAGTAVSLIDFGRIRGAIDAQRACARNIAPLATVI